MVQLARRFEAIGFSEIARIRNRMLELGSRQAKIHAFHGGEPLFDTPDFVKEAAICAVRENKTRYAPSSGIAPLREVVADKVRRKNKIPAEPKDVIVVNGGLHGLFCAFMVTVNPGDEVLVLSPYWTPIKDIITLAGGDIRLVSTAEARREGFGRTLRAAVTEKSRVLYINSPANPTGVVLTVEELREIAEVAQRADLAVISDEAYEDLVYDTEHVSLASLPGMFEQTVSVFTLSKSYSMTGWRIGYVVAPELWMTGLRKITLNSVNVVNTPTQWAAVAAVTQGDQFIAEAVKAYRLRRDALVAGLRSVGFGCDLPMGTFYAFPYVEGVLGQTSWEAFETLLTRANISTVPGVVFGPHGEGHLRFTFSVALETIEAAIAELRRIV